jgi:hypothetical protein
MAGTRFRPTDMVLAGSSGAAGFRLKDGIRSGQRLNGRMPRRRRPSLTYRSNTAINWLRCNRSDFVGSTEPRRKAAPIVFMAGRLAFIDLSDARRASLRHSPTSHSDGL